jgi:hypothetical protein
MTEAHMAQVFGGPGLLLMVVPLAVLGIQVWALVDAAMRPDAVWKAAGSSKTLWVVLLAVGLVLSIIGLVLAIVYLAGVRGRLKAAPG